MIECARCGYRNDGAAKFCAACGAPMMPAQAPPGMPQEAMPPPAWGAPQANWAAPAAAQAAPQQWGAPPAQSAPQQWGAPPAHPAPQQWGAPPAHPAPPAAYPAVQQPQGYGQGYPPPAAPVPSNPAYGSPYGAPPWGAPAPVPVPPAWGQPAPTPYAAPLFPTPADVQALAPTAPEPVAQPPVVPTAASAVVSPLEADQVPGNAPKTLAAFLVTFEQNPIGDFWPIFQGQTLVGRKDSGTGLGLELDHPTTSSRHASIYAGARPGRIKVEDLGSTNGTYVNERRLEPGERRALEPGDTLRFGGFSLTIHLVG